MLEPRGGPFHNANILLPPSNPEADMGFVILESTEYPPMSGSNTICVATVLLETGLIQMKEPYTKLALDAPGGLIHVNCKCENRKVKQVEFVNVPAFVINLDSEVDIPGYGSIKVDTSYGGMMFAHVKAEELGFQILPEEAHKMCLMGQKIKKAVNDQYIIQHPLNSKISGISNVIFEGCIERRESAVISKNATVVLHGRMDRSPCGTGTSGRLAVMEKRGIIQKEEKFENYSITGTKFSVVF